MAVKTKGVGPESLRVMVIDPGVNTGWVATTLTRPHVDSEGAHVAVRLGLLDRGQTGKVRGRVAEIGVAMELVRRMVVLGIEHVVMEDFILFPDAHHGQERDGLAPVRMISRIEDMICIAREPLTVEITMQMPGQKDVITDERLRRWGLWNAGMPHLNDAMRHAVVFARSW